MKLKIVLVLFLFFISGIITFSFNEERDYHQLFISAKELLSPPDEKGELKPIEFNEELKGILESGLDSFNVLAPYTRMEKDIKSILGELANFRFSLRSATSTEIYKSGVHSTVLIVAPKIGSGAGFVIDRTKGLVVTNFHVTRGLKNVLVAFYDPKIQDPSELKFHLASVVKYSAKRDVAVLKLLSLPRGLQELSFDETMRIDVGEEIHTIGHPLSFTWTYSHGVITAIRNKFQFGEEEIADVIQIDASISPGNSGGPLLNEAGKVIGLVTFSSPDQYAQNLNFAISNKDIKRVLSLSKNEDTTISKSLQFLYGSKLFSISDVYQNCDVYSVDKDRDGVDDYYSFVNKKTNIEEYRFVAEYETEGESGEKQTMNILFMDISQDGIMDIYFFDYDLDLKFDSIAVDANLDGELDIVGIDDEGKGYITKVWIL